MSLGSIDHIVVLMLEIARSTACWQAVSKIAKLRRDWTAARQNHDVQGVAVPVGAIPGPMRPRCGFPTPDPGELWTDINAQLFGTANVPTPCATPTMDGFVKNYLGQKNDESVRRYNAKNDHALFYIQTGAGDQCARSTVRDLRDHWFASAPCRPGRTVALVHDGNLRTGTRTNEPYICPTWRRSITASSKPALQIGRLIFTTWRKPTRFCSFGCWEAISTLSTVPS